MKDKDNDNNDENDAQNKDNKKYLKKIESMWMIILNNNNYSNNK